MTQPPGILQKVTVAIAWMAVVLLWTCALAVYISPEHCRWLGVLTLGFPFFLLGVLLVWPFVLLFARRWWWVPLLGLTLCFFTIRTYYPINIPSSPPKGCIKVLSYNTCGFAGLKKDSMGRYAVAEYLAASQADIICLQEAGFADSQKYDSVYKQLRETYQYYDTIHIGLNTLSVLTNYRVLRHHVICQNGLNGAAEFTLLPASGDTIHLINCHLYSMHISPDERASYANMVTAAEGTEDPEATSRLLLSKISRAAVERARQADELADYLKQLEGRNVIVCGDFNDSPVSYTHHRIASCGLTDAFVAAGNGLGRSFNRDAIVVRIDNILHSKHWKAYRCEVDDSNKDSDHYPIACYLKRLKGQ